MNDKEYISHKHSIVVENLNFSYDNNKTLSNLNFYIHPKEMVTIVGPNGGGKTTLLKLLLGLLKPDSGTIKIFNEKVSTGKNHIAYVPQYASYDHLFPVTVFEVVLMGRLKNKWGFYSAEDKKIAEKSLEKVHILNLKKSSFANLSGGQRQRVMIARALASENKILLMDEPTANVDSAVEDQLTILLKELKSSMNIILVTHDVVFVSKLTDRVLCINNTIKEHPVENLAQESLASIWGKDLKLVRHDINSKEFLHTSEEEK